MTKIPSLRYIAVAIALKIFSSTTYMRNLYRFLGNNLGHRHTMVTEIELSRGMWLIQKIIEAGFSTDEELTILELGTGWTHFYAILLRLFVHGKITLFDIQDNRNFKSLNRRCANLLNYVTISSQLGANHINKIEDARELLRKVVAVKNFDQLYQLLNMKYLIDPRGSLDSIPENAFDIVFSVDVLEHVGGDTFDRLTQDIYRILRPGEYLFIRSELMII